MSHLVQSIEHAVEAGVKGFIDYMGVGAHADSAPQTPATEANKADLTPTAHPDSRVQPASDSQPQATAIPVSSSSGDLAASAGPASATSPISATSAGQSLASRIAQQTQLVQLFDVPSGWIHLQSTYVDSAGGQRRVRQFGLRNLTAGRVDVEIASDLGSQVVFWVADDDSDALSTTSSLSSVAIGSQTLNLSIPGSSSAMVYLAFQPTGSEPVTPGSLTPSSEGGVTPRIAASVPTIDPGPVPGGRLPSAGTSILSDSTSMSTSSLSLSVGAVNARRSDTINRSYSVHGSILIHVSTQDTGDVLCPPAHQNITLPFFASVCKSVFTAGVIDPVSGLASGPQLSQGQLTVDFGSDTAVGVEVHRDILLVNRSEIDLVWTSAVVNSRFKDRVWFQLRDLDSENVFGVDSSSEPVPLPPLSSRHLRLTLCANASVADFDFDFVISNAHQSGNAVTCHVVGSCPANGKYDHLRILSGSMLDFGQIPDGVWSKKLLVAKNIGDRPIDVHFSATPGYEVVFRLAGVAGEDIDEDLPTRLPRDKRADPLSRTSTRDDRSRGRMAGSDVASSLSNLTRSQLLSDGGSVGSSAVSAANADEGSAVASSDRDSSLPPSRSLSRVTSRASSYRPTRGDIDSDEDDVPSQSQHLQVAPEAQAEMRHLDNLGDRDIPNQIEELTMRPGTEYRVFAMYRPERDLVNPPEIAGAFRTSEFKINLDSALSSQRSRPTPRSQNTVHCVAESCTSIISIPSGHLIDFGEVTVGASKSTTITIKNESALSARVEVAAISKVLNTNRNIIVIPPYETVNERLDFFPRRINERYEKQVFVRNLLNKHNNQLVEVRSKNVDVYNVTLHSHLYRILTPSGSNFLDFGSVVINSPTVRTVQFQNLTHKPLTLDLSASQPEDVEMYIRMSDAPPTPCKAHPLIARYAHLDQADRPANGNLKERFVESLEDKEKEKEKENGEGKSKAKREKNSKSHNKDHDKQSLGASLAHALKKGNRGKHVHIYDNSVMFKDRSLLDDQDYLDLATGPPTSHKTAPQHSKRDQKLENISYEDKTKLAGKHPRVPDIDFAALAKSNGLLSKDVKTKKSKSTAGSKRDPSTPTKSSRSERTEKKPTTPPSPSHPTGASALKQSLLKSQGPKSPALTGKRQEPKGDPSGTDVANLTADELILALEQHDAKRAQTSVNHFTPEEEEHYVKRLIALRKELQNAVQAGKFVPARTLTVPPGSSRQLIVVLTPNGSTRPHITTRAKRAESRIFIKLVDYDKTMLNAVVGDSHDVNELPVRDLVIRSSCVRSVLEVQQSSINFGTCERGDTKSRTIVIHNKSDCVGVFRMRTSGSIASGNLKLGVGRYGVISAFGRKEVASFSFTPSLVGNYNETITVENVLDSHNDQSVLVKATVRKMPTFSLDVTKLDIAPNAPGTWPTCASFVVTNTSKSERTLVIEASEVTDAAFAEVSLSRDEKDAGSALSKGEEEEVEGLLQKLKIARRKNKADKIAKYEKRLGELGVATATSAAEEPTPEDDVPSGTVTPANGEVVSSPSITVTLQPNKKAKILVNLVARDAGSAAFDSTIKVYEKKNTDETVTIDVAASPNPIEAPAQAPATTSEGELTFTSAEPDMTDPLNLALMKHCLDLTLQCPVSPTAFCVGSTLFLPASSPFYERLKDLFPIFNDPTTGKPAGLLLADGYSRQIPGNTHAEANALTNFRERMNQLEEEASHPNLPTADDVLAQSECFATMEPCSVRTSGGPSCALELVRAHVRAVFLGVEEPPDFVQCEGVRILDQGGVEVRRVVGLEDECLKAARRGRS